MSKIYDRILAPLNTKEPKGHCETVKYRHHNGLAVADRNFKRELRVTK